MATIVHGFFVNGVKSYQQSKVTFLFHRQPQSYITPSPSLSPNWNGDADHGSVEANSQLSPRRARMIIAVKGAD